MTVQSSAVLSSPVTENDLFQITKTNTKRYVGLCNFDGCDWRTNVESLRLNAAVKVRDHARIAHGSYAADLFLKRESNMRDPSTTAPPRDRLSDWKDHIVIFTDGKKDTMDTVVNGAPRTSEVVKAVAWAYDEKKKEWIDLGETPIFWNAVKFRIMEDPVNPGELLDTQPDTIAGKLVQPGGRDNSPYDLVAVGANDKAGFAAIKKWSEKHEEPF